MKEKKVLVIGGGAAGMMAALTAAGSGHSVTLLEKNGRIGKKLSITGNGRCNVTNACDIETLLDHVVSNRNFLYSAFYSFSNEDMMRFLEESGLETKVEQERRVFPVTDRAEDVVRVLEKRMKAAGVRVRTGAAVQELRIEEVPAETEEVMQVAEPDADDVNLKKKGTKLTFCRGVILKNGEQLEADVTILATGGKSVPATGSTGDGYRMAEAAGHTIRPLRPALAPFVIQEGWIRDLQGRVFQDVFLTVSGREGRRLYENRGDVLFTHFGISGPMVLAAGSFCADSFSMKKNAAINDTGGGTISALLDFVPEVTEKELENEFINLLNTGGKKQVGTVLTMIAPKALVPVLLQKNKIPDDRRAGELSRTERQSLIRDLKSLSLTVTGLRGFKEAMVTQGGVCVDEVDPVTMESLLVKGLRFAGEILDLDALTGGFNLQIAWSTGHSAGSLL